jgi:hypothetical protein
MVLIVDHVTINIKNRKFRSVKKLSKYRVGLNSWVVLSRDSIVPYSAISDERRVRNDRSNSVVKSQ